ncbi:MAG: sigma-54 dependent transcriptional regulator [Campylobacteraceae bacterium]|nr:sigma-54 dependent transcriptional regulator [Campylobacteraceae bacterium]
MNIAIIDDQEDIQYAIEKILTKEGHTCYGFYGNEDDLIEGFEVFNIELAIIDMMLKDSLSGLDVFKRLKQHNFKLPTIMITAYTTPSNMIEASLSGITDIIKKPFSSKDILDIVNKYTKKTKSKHISLVQDNEEFIGSFETMKDVYKLIGIAANCSSNVFIYGDTGTGKELVAKLIHKNSPREQKQFVAVNCSTIPQNLFEKLMFGSVKNYFKNDKDGHIGYVQQCEKGTLFLDGVYNLSIQTQSKLLRFLETKSYYPLGSSREIKFTGRIICTSIKNPKELLEDKNFRDDLYYRISTIEVGLPSLEKRKKDIKELTHYFIKLYNNELNLNFYDIDSDALCILENHIFNGNIRELKNIIYKAMISSRENNITSDNLDAIISHTYEHDDNQINLACCKILELYDKQNLDKLFIDFEKEILKILLQRNPNISQLAKSLSISRNTLKDRIKKYGLKIQ